MNCLPVYIVIDSSFSMKPFEDVLNASIETLYDELIVNPRISEFASISILSYNTDAEVVLGMSELSSVTAVPNFDCGGITDFGKVLRLLRQCIDADIDDLNGSGREVLRPVIFLLTDGVPTDSQGHATDAWQSDFRALVDPSWRRHPNVVPFGYGNATPEIIGAFATIDGAAFLSKDGGTGDALSRIIPTLLNTLVASAKDNALRLPSEVDGFIRVTPEIVE